jgi:transposase
VRRERGRRRRRSVSRRELVHYRRRFLDALREDGVVCLECGRILVVIGRHLDLHDQTLDEYRAKWGYDRTTTFAAARIRQLRRRVALRINLGRYGGRHVLRKAWAARRRMALASRLESRLARSRSLKRRYEAGWHAEPHERGEDAVLRLLVAQRHQVREIAARAGMTAPTVRRRLRAMGVEPPKLLPKVSDARLLALRRQGLWSHEIARRVGLTTSSVNRRWRDLRRRRVKVPPAAGPRPSGTRRVTDDELLRLARRGLDVRAIARRKAVTTTTIWRRLKRLRARGVLPRGVSDAARAPRRMAQRRAAARLERQRIDKRARKITARDRAIVRLARRRLWPSQIEARLGLPRHSVGRRLWELRRRGVRMPRPAGKQPNPARKVTDEQLVGFLRQGLRAIEIAERVGQTRMNVYLRLRQLVKDGLVKALPKPVRRGPPQQVSDEALVRLARQGLGTREIARRTRVARITVNRRLKSLRERGVIPPLLSVIDRGRPILELRRAGLWPLEIAARLGMQPQSVRKWLWKLRRLGVTIPRPRRLPPNFRRDLVGRR